MKITINHKITELGGDATILDAIRLAGENFYEPASGPAEGGIAKLDCPHLRLAEINGELVPAPLLGRQTVRDGMTILTRSPQLETALADRVSALRERHECHLMRECQKLVAVEGENAGFIEMEKWEQAATPLRNVPPALVHDPGRCIRCRACVEVCRSIQTVEALSFDPVLGVQCDERRCVRCGQCALVCPMGAVAARETIADLLECGNCQYVKPPAAMREADDTSRAEAVLKDPERYCVAQFAPAVRASLGEEFGIRAGELVTGKIYAALRRLGFKKVWDTNFAADLTIMEEGHELLERITKGAHLPMFTSCSPGWIRFVETFFPSLRPHLSTAKSPQQMFGAMAKAFAAERLGIGPAAMTVVSFMPCTAKKAEAARPEMNGAFRYLKERRQAGIGESFPDVDLVLTTRELARLLKAAKIDLRKMPDEQPDSLLGEYTGAAPIFGRTGGVMEAALRTVTAVLTKQSPAALEFHDLGTWEGIKRTDVKIGKTTLKAAVAHGLGNARKICESVKAGGEFVSYHFIEVMTCPRGCIGGGGQPIPTNSQTTAARTRGVNRDDREKCAARMSHLNREIKALYEGFLEKPLGHVSRRLLHTTYVDRSAL